MQNQTERLKSGIDSVNSNNILADLANKRSNQYRYTAYGLEIKSTIELPELISSAQANIDVEIDYATLQNSPLEDLDKYFFCCNSTDEGLYAYWRGLGTIFISEGKKISIEPVADFDERRLRLFILGAALGAILHQRGYLVLHGSVVNINNKAVVFIADKGKGKSTIAADIQLRGHQFLTDDVVAIDVDSQEKPLVYPAFPQLKLWPDSVSQLGKNPEELPKLIERQQKREYLVKNNFCSTPLEIKQIFVLDYGDEIAIKPIAPQNIFTNLLRHSYVARFGSALLDSKDISHLSRLTYLTKQTPINLLSRPKNLALLSQVSQTVESYVSKSN